MTLFMNIITAKYNVKQENLTFSSMQCGEDYNLIYNTEVKCTRRMKKHYRNGRSSEWL